MKRVFYIVFAAVGFVASAYLIPSYLDDSTVGFCPSGGDGSGCDLVRLSEYSDLLGIPLPIWGAAFYAGIIIYSLIGLLRSAWITQLEGTCNRLLASLLPKKDGKSRKLYFKPDSWAIGFGFLFSMYLTYLEAYVIEAWCFYCVVQAIASTLLFITMLEFTPKFYSLSYRYILKPLLFRFDAEKVHDFFVESGEKLGEYKFTRNLLSEIFYFEDTKLKTSVGSVDIVNPIGLAAGFDYDAHLTTVLRSVGFGYESVGTVTFSKYEGNEKPRLGRLPKSKSLLVNKGFKNEGIEEILNDHIKFVSEEFRIGISIGATNSPQTADTDSQVEDIFKSFQFLIKHPTAEQFAYCELNISCPNVLGSGHLAEPVALRKVLNKIRTLELKKPLFVKFPAEIEWEDARELITIMVEFGVKAVIMSNLVKDRSNSDFDSNEINSIKDRKGNFSGKPVQALSDELIRKTYIEFGDRIDIIGLGGIFTAQDAYRKIRLGASSVQMITGMIFNGPSVVNEIKKGLVGLLEADGLSSVSEAVGKDAHK
jgi:dihydroorotate dehydrogenase subfamily 2